MAVTLLAATTSSAQSTKVVVGRGEVPREQRPISISAPGMAGAENADVQFSQDGGTTWNDLFEDGVQIRLTATNNMITIFGPGVFRIDKEATAAAVGVFEHNPGNP